METIEFDLEIEGEEEPIHSNWQESVEAIISGRIDPGLLSNHGDQYD